MGRAFIVNLDYLVDAFPQNEEISISISSVNFFNGLNGGVPAGGVIQGTDGSFYGTTTMGGSPASGVIFKIMASGTLTAIYSFCAQSGCPDGEFPYGALVEASDGNFYGTT